MGCTNSKEHHADTNKAPADKPSTANTGGAVPSSSGASSTLPASSSSNALASSSGSGKSTTTADQRRIQDFYDIGDVLGSGSYSVVKIGTSKANPSLKVAVKILTRAKMKPEDEVGIRREVDVMRSLDHPNIVKLIDFFQDSLYFYVVMEYVGGGELFERLVEKAVYTEEEARELALIMFQAIKYMHDKDLVHRDIKPENILLVSKENDVSLKIADFGFAVRLNGTAGVKQQAGTPGYVSPEVIERKTHGKPVDLWAMGVVLFMLLGGYPPFYEPDGNTKNMYRRIIVGDYHFHPDYWSEVSSEAKDLVKGLLTVDPSKRLTVEQALAHPWIKKPKEELSLVPLVKTITSLREYQRSRIANNLKSANAAIAVATIDVVKKISSAALVSSLNLQQAGANSSSAGAGSSGGNSPGTPTGSSTSTTTAGNLASAVASLTMSSAGSTALQDVAIDVIRKLSNTNLNADVIEAARKKSGVALASSSARRGSNNNTGIPGANYASSTGSTR